MFDELNGLYAAQAASVMVIIQIISVLVAARSGRLGLVQVSSALMTAAAVVFVMLPFAGDGASRIACLIFACVIAGCYAFLFKRAVLKLRQALAN